jgi:hypothetical protein
MATGRLTFRERHAAPSSTRGTVKHFAVTVALATTVGIAPAIAAQANEPASTHSATSSLTLRALDGRDHRVTPVELAMLHSIDTTVTAHQVTGENRPARWVRQVVRIEVRSAP